MRKNKNTWLAVMAVSTLLGIPAALAGQETPRNVTLQFHFVLADGFDEIDPAIADIVEELQQVFRFNGYRLVDSPRVTGVVGEDSGFVGARVAGEELGVLDLEATIESTPDPESVRVRVYLHGPGTDRRSDIMQVSVMVRDEQTVILGSARPEASAGALILVMSADIEE